MLVPSVEARPAAEASISKRLPPEILWLFRYASGQRRPFYTWLDSALRSTVERGAIGYTDLTKALVDQFFTSEKAEIRYESVLDLKDLFILDQYRINQLR